MVEGAHTVAAIILETVVGTNGILVPPAGYLAGVREHLRRVRHRDDRRRGDGRLRPLRRVVRRRPLGRDARPDHLRQGRQLRLRAARRRDHLRRDRGDLRRARLPRRAHLLRPPAGLRQRRRLDQHLQGRGHRRARPRASAPTSSAPSWRKLADRHPSVGEVRGLGVFWALELVRDRETREPLVPFNAAGAGRRADERVRRRVQAARAVAVHPLQPHPRRAAVHHHARPRCARASPSSTRRSRSPTATTPADSSPKRTGVTVVDHEHRRARRSRDRQQRSVRSPEATLPMAAMRVHAGRRRRPAARRAPARSVRSHLVGRRCAAVRSRHERSGDAEHPVAARRRARSG